MTKYLVDLLETPEDDADSGLIVFICWADDEDHAIEQALDMYKSGVILTVFNTGVEYNA